MFVPGPDERMMASAARSDADVLFLDIEDSVQPFFNKQIARDTIKKLVSAKKFTKHLVFPRVNCP